MKLVERGHFVVGSMDIRQKAKGWLTELSQRTGQTTHLGILDGREGVYIEKIEGKLAAIAYSRIGRRLPVHATAIGKVLIAWLGEAELNALLEGYQYTTFTPSTLASREALVDALKKPASKATPWIAKRTSRACAAWRCRCGTTSHA
jgi:DNA-binding IclR family transcriptional regulator